MIDTNSRGPNIKLKKKHLKRENGTTLLKIYC